jgi:HSP20 family protein
MLSISTPVAHLANIHLPPSHEDGRLGKVGRTVVTSAGSFRADRHLGDVMNTTRLPTLFSEEPFVFDDAFRTFMRPFRWEPKAETPQIKIDVAEADDAYTVKAEIPGVRKEDIHVEIDGAKVLITAEVKKDFEEKKEGRMLRSERSYGFTSRMFTLGFELDRAKAAAKYTDGVLTLTLPKLATAHSEPLKIL